MIRARNAMQFSDAALQLDLNGWEICHGMAQLSPPDSMWQDELIHQKIVFVSAQSDFLVSPSDVTAEIPFFFLHSCLFLSHLTKLLF